MTVTATNGSGIALPGPGVECVPESGAARLARHGVRDRLALEDQLKVRLVHSSTLSREEAFAELVDIVQFHTGHL